MCIRDRDKLNAYVVVSDSDDSTSDSGGNRLLWITEKGSEELNAGEVFEEIGGSVWRRCV